MRISWPQGAGFLAVLVAVGVGVAQLDAGQAGGFKTPGKDVKQKTTKDTKEPAPAPEETQIKIFTLSHASPQEIQQALNQLAGPVAAGKLVSPYPGVAVGLRTSPRIAVDTASKTVFVRGTAKQVGLVERLLSVLDADPGQPPPEAKGLHLIRLKHAKAGEVMKVLTTLELQAQILPLNGNNSLLFLPGASAEHAREVIGRLDRAPDGEAPKTIRKSPKTSGN
jgi:hypothetical protein